MTGTPEFTPVPAGAYAHLAVLDGPAPGRIGHVCAPLAGWLRWPDEAAIWVAWLDPESGVVVTARGWTYDGPARFDIVGEGARCDGPSGPSDLRCRMVRELRAESEKRG